MDKRTKRRLVKLVLAFVIILAGNYLVPQLRTQPNKTPPPSGYYHVTTFNDGDTITVDMAGQAEKIRMIGVDTPETEDPRKPVQCFGKAASSYTKALIGNEPVRLEADATNTNRDRYQRLLRYVYLQNGTLVNYEIIAEGYGFAYTGFPFTKSEEFKRAQEAAQQQRKGLWSACQPKSNQYGGHDSNPE